MSWLYFTEKEMSCNCPRIHSVSNPPKNADFEEFMGLLVGVRKACGFPFIINSGYRCPEHNKEVSTTGEGGPHTIGAADIKISGYKAYQLVKVAIAHGMTGIGIKQNGPTESRYIHLDNLNGETRPWIWSY